MFDYQLVLKYQACFALAKDIGLYLDTTPTGFKLFKRDVLIYESIMLSQVEAFLQGKASV